MDQLSAIQNFLSGRKTYLIALSAFIALLTGWVEHSVSNQQFIEQAVGLLLAMTIRHGVSTAVSAAVNDAVEPTKAKLPQVHQLSQTFTADDGVEVKVYDKL